MIFTYYLPSNFLDNKKGGEFMFECKANTEHFVGFRIKLYPTEAQKVILNRNIELYRYVYNWSISTIDTIYKETGKFTRYIELSNIFSKYRNEIEWLKQFPLNSARIAIRSAIKAFIYFFGKRNKFPVFKTKKRSKMIFGVRGERVYIYNDGYVSIEGMGPNNRILYKNSNLPKDIQYPPRLYNVWILYDKDNYWLSFQLEYNRFHELDIPKSEAIGIDVGLRKLAVLSNGKEYVSPNTKRLQNRLDRLRAKALKKYSKIRKIASQTKTKFEDMPKSNKLLKLEKNIRKTKKRISNIQRSFIHQITKEIVETNPQTVVVETISPLAMVHVTNADGRMVVKKNLAREVYRQSLSTFMHCLEYKSKERGIDFIKAPKDFPSSQMCSSCGHLMKINNKKIYKCPNCGLIIDRDLNAAINLRNLAYQ